MPTGELRDRQVGANANRDCAQKDEEEYEEIIHGSSPTTTNNPPRNHRARRTFPIILSLRNLPRWASFSLTRHQYGVAFLLPERVARNRPSGEDDVETNCSNIAAQSRQFAQ